MEVKPIAIDKQIDNVLFGQSDNEIKEVNKKVEFIVTNIDKVISVNGSVVFNPMVIDGNIWYNLSKPPKMFEHILNSNARDYYYPIQYANIKLKED